MPVKRWGPVVALVVVLGLTPRGAWAYGSDIHFSLTYVLCRLAGIEANDALWIAAADQSLDNNETTTAFPGILGTLNQKFNPLKKKIYSKSGEFWHSFSDENGGTSFPVITYSDGGQKARTKIRERKDALFGLVPNGTLSSAGDTARIKADIAFGQFLHFQQDYFSHRQLTPDRDDDNAYLPYGTSWGHALNGILPDEVVRYPHLAKRMAVNNYGLICNYAVSAFGKSPNRNLNLDPLIDAVASAYVPESTHGLPQTTTQYEGFPASSLVNAKLVPCLKRSFASAWPGPAVLPTYKEPHCELTLPYDTPTTPLSEVIQRFQVATKQLSASP